MALLAINCGSSSTKVSFYGQEQWEKQIDAGEALDELLATIDSPVDKVGHRFVHGGSQFQEPTLIDEATLEALEALIELAPLHNGACLAGIRAAQKHFPDALHVAIFDTAFFSTLPPEASTYALPRDLMEKYRIRRYGFHGISHQFLWNRYAELIDPNHKILSLHLGNGCSITATDQGRPIATSMGFTPTEGLVMGTRCGDIDPAILPLLAERENLSPKALLSLINHQSGLLGLSGISSNMAILLSSDSPQAKLAVDLFCHRLLHYCGALSALLGGPNALIFAGGIGEKAPSIRARLAESLAFLGVELDPTLNSQATALPSGTLQRISTSSSTPALYVIATDENLAISEILNSFY